MSKFIENKRIPKGLGYPISAEGVELSYRSFNTNPNNFSFKIAQLYKDREKDVISGKLPLYPNIDNTSYTQINASCNGAASRTYKKPRCLLALFNSGLNKKLAEQYIAVLKEMGLDYHLLPTQMMQIEGAYIATDIIAIQAPKGGSVNRATLGRLNIIRYLHSCKWLVEYFVSLATNEKYMNAFAKLIQEDNKEKVLSYLFRYCHYTGPKTPPTGKRISGDLKTVLYFPNKTISELLTDSGNSGLYTGFTPVINSTNLYHLFGAYTYEKPNSEVSKEDRQKVGRIANFVGRCGPLLGNVGKIKEYPELFKTYGGVMGEILKYYKPNEEKIIDDRSR